MKHQSNFKDFIINLGWESLFIQHGNSLENVLKMIKENCDNRITASYYIFKAKKFNELKNIPA